MKRKCLSKLMHWAKREERGAMVLRGARQVGKTHLVRSLAKTLNLTLVELNMEEEHGFVKMLHKKDKAKEILELILLERGIAEDPKNVLIFFDEAQQVAELYRYLRYFKEKCPEYKVIAAGSLFDLVIQKASNDGKSQGPTGRVEYTYLNPMTFEEFLMAKNEVAYRKLSTLSLLEPIPLPLHNVYNDLFKEYLVSGGMPAAVKAMVNDEGALRVDEIKSDIITGYIDDFPKYSELSGKKYDSDLLTLLFTKVMGRPANGMKYVELAPGYRAEVVRSHLKVLEDARVIRRSFSSSENKLPLIMTENKKAYKLFSLDVGFCYSYMEMPLTTVYVTEDVNDLAKGAIAEQYVAQTLMSIPPHHKARSLNHWENDKRGTSSEVDFVVGLAGKAIPIECKSGLSSKMKSLFILLKKKHYPIALRVFAGNIEIQSHDFGFNEHTHLISIPHYFLERFASNFDEVLSEL